MMNVLLVDDEPLVLEGLKTMVNWTSYGFQVCGEALSGSDALDMIQQMKPDLVLTDVNMPGISGLELIKQTNDLLTNPPKFVILSGYDNFEYAITAMQQRVAEYLLKPIDDEEIEAILSRLGKKIQDERAEEQSQLRLQSLYISNLLNRLIQGENNEVIKQQAIRSLNLPADSELRCILIDGTDNEHLMEQVRQHLPEGTIHLFQDSSSRTGAILPVEDFSADRLKEIILRLHCGLTDTLKQPVIVTVSGCLRGIGSIRDLYLQALDVNQCKRHQGKEGIFYFQETECIPLHYSNQDKFKQLLELVTGTGDPEKISCYAEDALNSLSAGLNGLDQAKALVADLELNLCRVISENKGDPDAFMKPLKEQYGSLASFDQFSLIKQYILKLCQGAVEFLATLEEKNEGNTIYHVIQYVDREFRNRLQLQDLARSFHMNATYLGQLFKKETGTTFNEYLNDKRIEEAKRLLKRTQMKISDVAVQVGYSNTDYFISKFKCKTGALPSVYKNEFEDRMAE